MVGRPTFGGALSITDVALRLNMAYHGEMRRITVHRGAIRCHMVARGTDKAAAGFLRGFCRFPPDPRLLLAATNRAW